MSKRLNLDPGNELEFLQIAAAKDPAERERFWKLLLSSDVWVLADQLSETNLVLNTWGTNGSETCGVFTSQALVDRAMEPETPWVKVNATVVFKSMIDAGLGVFINPRYDAQVRLRTKDLALLLDGNFSMVQGTNA